MYIYIYIHMYIYIHTYIHIHIGFAKWRIRDGQRAGACKLPGLSTLEDGPLHWSCGF